MATNVAMETARELSGYLMREFQRTLGLPVHSIRPSVDAIPKMQANDSRWKLFRLDHSIENRLRATRSIDGDIKAPKWDGFRLGSSVTEQRVHIERLLQDGFRVAAAREAVSDAEPVMLLRDDAQGRTDAVCLVRNQAGELVEISVAIQGGIVAGHDDARAAAATLREQVRAELGAPALELDFVDLWAAEGAYEDTQAVAYGACWAETSAKTTRKAESSSDYQRLMGQLPGPLATVHISTSRVGDKLAVIAMLNVRR